ncbi:MAG: 16S rRNA (cytosine(1402)-N(4))-methyltransferase RsmH [bacterium]|nr:16S rRNA (cytosine(1402)-N(4))-methyltransferase RsmH [bacterium]
MHIPVLLNEVMEILKPQKGEFFIDGTFGAGGHSEKILEAIGEKGKLLAFDWDPKASERNIIILEKKNFTFANVNYANAKKFLQENNLPKADGLLLDLGFSSDQLEDSGKGFSFKKDEPLVMSYGESGPTAYEVVNTYSEEKLLEIIKELGEERFPGRIARVIVENRQKEPIKTSLQLARIIRSALPRNYEKGRIDPATRTFQALRIYVNGELENIKKILGDLESIVKSGGRVAVISFHSLEDRIVKNIFRDLKKSGKAELLNKKIISASRDEISNNPRSRSAKLRGLKII